MILQKETKQIRHRYPYCIFLISVVLVNALLFDTL